jgi:signal peptidase II
MWTFSIAASFVALLDQITKRMVIERVPYEEGVVVVSGLLNLVHARNPGAAFGIMADSGNWAGPAFFIAVSVVTLAAISWLVATSSSLDRVLLYAYSLFFGGALGNLIDRVRYGAVIDFIDVHIGEYHWPAFNVADSALCVGAGLFFMHFLIRKQPAKERERPPRDRV